MTPDNRAAILGGMPKPKTKLVNQQTAPPPAPVDVRQLPTVSCTLCPARLPHHPGQAAEVLTAHYNSEHLTELTQAGAPTR